MNKAAQFVVPSDHPALPGHFPGRPVVPGVMLLDRVLEAIVPEGSRAAGLPTVKFLRPVTPGECVEVFCDGGSQRLGFVCRVGEHEVVRGSVVLGGAA